MVALGTNLEFYIRFQQKGQFGIFQRCPGVIGFEPEDWSLYFLLLLMLTNSEIRYKKTKDRSGNKDCSLLSAG